LMVGTLFMPLKAQKLIDIYKSGTVKLIPDQSYAQENNWDEIFKIHDNKPAGKNESLKLMPDGSVVVNHDHRNFYSKFLLNGKFQKTFNIVNSKGAKLKKTRPIGGVINNEIFYTEADVSGNIHCFGFDGKYKKKLKVNYHAKQIISLPNGNLVLIGWTQWNNKFREFVAIINYDTNKEKIIWDYFTKRINEPKSTMFNYVYKFEKGGIISFPTMPFVNSVGLAAPPQIAYDESNIIVTIPTTGEILIYDLDGTLKSKTKVGWPNQSISVEEQRTIQQNAIDKYKKVDFQVASWVSKEENKKAQNQLVKEMEADLAKITKPITKPYYVTILKDSDNNLLFFEYPKEKNANKFNVWVYKNGGEFVCKSSFVCNDYHLEINPSKMVFHKGYIYALQKLKSAKENPLRLVRFKLE